MNRDELFRPVEPPRDGLARLRARLDADEGTRRRRRGVALVAACAACLAGALVSPLGPYQLTFLSEAPAPLARGRELRSVEHPALVALGMQPLSEHSVSGPVGELAREVPMAGDDVIYYVVAAVGHGAPPGTPAWESGGSRSSWEVGAEPRRGARDDRR